jgi:hypothetical protein
VVFVHAIHFLLALFKFSPNSSQLGQGSSQKGKSGGLSSVKVYRRLLLGSLNTISLFWTET